MYLDAIVPHLPESYGRGEKPPEPGAEPGLLGSSRKGAWGVLLCEEKTFFVCCSRLRCPPQRCCGCWSTRAPSTLRNCCCAFRHACSGCAHCLSDVCGTGHGAVRGAHSVLHAAAALRGRAQRHLPPSQVVQQGHRILHQIPGRRGDQPVPRAAQGTSRIIAHVCVCVCVCVFMRRSRSAHRCTCSKSKAAKSRGQWSRC